jgi:hypothetical protein
VTILLLTSVGGAIALILGGRQRTVPAARDVAGDTAA